MQKGTDSLTKKEAKNEALSFLLEGMPASIPLTSSVKVDISNVVSNEIVNKGPALKIEKEIEKKSK